MIEKTKAHELALKQKEISISEFFLKNRHLLGFDNPIRALLMVVKESVDNSLDACDEASVLPEIYVEIKKLSDDRFIVIVEDNGPGIIKQNIPNVFGKLLYGSKFHTLRQNRGQQGIGISAVVLYSQLTTGKPTKVISKISKNKPGQYYELQIDAAKNEPKILREEISDWAKDHGTIVEVELEGRYQKGKQSVDEYVREVAIVNPHAKIIYINPEKEKLEFPRATDKLPVEAKEIKPHPYGIELGTLMYMISSTKSRTLQSFLASDFCRVGPKVAKEICNKAKLKYNERPSSIDREGANSLLKAIKETKIIAPPTDCLSPIGAEYLEKSLKKEINAEFFVSCSRSPSVYRGFPFIVEVGIAYGGDLPKEDDIRLMRFANKVPLLYQTKACAISESVCETNWRPYGLQQGGKNMPVGPMVLVVHLSSVWVPFTSEAKEAIAHYDEIIKEIKLALQECGRKLSMYINKKQKINLEAQRKDYIEKYIPHIGIALKNILNLTNEQENKVVKTLKEVLEKSREK